LNTAAVTNFGLSGFGAISGIAPGNSVNPTAARCGGAFFLASVALFQDDWSVNSRSYLLPILLLVCTLAFTVPGAIKAEAPAKATPGPNDPSPQTRTFFIEGVKSDADVKAITDAVMKVKSVTKVAGLSSASGFANISFDHHAVTHQQIAQAIADAGAFKASFRFAIPEYAAHAEKIDALFAKLKDEVTIDCTNKEKGEFTLHFLPLKPSEPSPHGVGFNFGKIGHPVSDPPPKGLGLKFVNVNPPAAK
jgi:copper chaperone CopZ